MRTWNRRIEPFEDLSELAHMVLAAVGITGTVALFATLPLFAAIPLGIIPALCTAYIIHRIAFAPELHAEAYLITRDAYNLKTDAKRLAKDPYLKGNPLASSVINALCNQYLTIHMAGISISKASTYDPTRSERLDELRNDLNTMQESILQLNRLRDEEAKLTGLLAADREVDAAAREASSTTAESLRVLREHTDLVQQTREDLQDK